MLFRTKTAIFQKEKKMYSIPRPSSTQPLLSLTLQSDHNLDHCKLILGLHQHNRHLFCICIKLIFARAKKNEFR